MPRTRIKICGITNLDDALAAIDAGADAVGFILHAKSPRVIDSDLARTICRAIPPLVSRVGVFVDASATFVAQAVRNLPLDFAQLHGSESPDYVRSLASFRIIRATRLENAADWIATDIANLSAVLVDSASGGSGIENDWAGIEALMNGTKTARPLIVAGGLNPENVAGVVRRLRPFAVDVASGVEASPGQKSAEKIRAFVSAVRDADASA